MNNNKMKNIVDHHEDSNLGSISLKEKELPLRHGMHNYKSLISVKGENPQKTSYQMKTPILANFLRFAPNRTFVFQTGFSTISCKRVFCSNLLVNIHN